MITFHLPLHQLPRITYANDIKNFYDFVHFERKSEEYIFFYIVEGDMYLEEDGCQYHLRKGDYILLDPSRTHRGYKTAPVHYYYIHFDWNEIKEVEMSEEELRLLASNNRMTASGLIQRNNPPEPVLVFPKHYTPKKSGGFHKAQHICQEMKIFYHEMMEYYHSVTAAKFLELLANIARQIDDDLMATQKKDTTGAILSLLQFLKSNYKNKITSKEIEKELHINFDYLNRQFKKKTDKTIFQYLTEYRIEKSKDYLTGKYYPLQQIALETGFTNEFYFSRVFKKVTGMSPNQYRKIIQENSKLQN